MASCLFRTTQQTLRANEIFNLFCKVARSLILDPTTRSLENAGGEVFQQVTTKPIIYNFLFKDLFGCSRVKIGMSL
jgi:hypothetical protein